MRKEEIEKFQGTTVDQLTAVRFLRYNGHGQQIWEFACSCGGSIEALKYYVIRGSVTSCGCIEQQNPIYKEQDYPTKKLTKEQEERLITIATLHKRTVHYSEII